jgi:uncharacterized protein (TIGR02145 family)
LGFNGELTDTLGFELAAVDKSKFTYQWYKRDPETLRSTLIAGATTDSIFINESNKASYGITTAGKVYQFYCVVISGSQYGISGTGRVVYGPGVRIANGGWIKVANANLGADQKKLIGDQLTYLPQVSESGEAADKAYDPIVYGDWYQWGRKHDGHQDRKTSAANTNSDYLSTMNGVGADSLDASGQIKDNLPAISGKFIQRNGGTIYDWRQYPEADGNFAEAPALSWTWGNPVEGVTDSDPCRSELGGNWRVPTQAEWAQIISNNTWVWQDRSPNGTSGYQIKPGGTNKPTALFLPAAGGRYRNGGAQFDVGSSLGYYWSSTIVNTSSYRLGFSNVSSTTNAYNRSNGFSVRCVSE